MTEKTLADYRNRPHTRPIQFGDVMVPDILESFGKRFPLNVDLRQPEELAIEFYLLNGAVAQLRQNTPDNKPLTVHEIVLLDEYYDSLEKIGHRAFHYLLLICTRETRHCGSTTVFKEKLKPFGALEFWATLRGLDSDAAVDRFLNLPPKITLKNYVDHLVLAFLHGTHSNGYAGAAWKDVAQPLRDFVHGVISMEVLVDTVWTLAHNGGPIFNKGMLFREHNEILRVLDVQKAGQIPNLVRHGESTHVKAKHVTLLNTCVLPVLPELGKDPVNWQTVNQLGGHEWKTWPYKKVQPELCAKPKLTSTTEFMIPISPFEDIMKIKRKDLK